MYVLKQRDNIVHNKLYMFQIFIFWSARCGGDNAGFMLAQRRRR